MPDATRPFPERKRSPPSETVAGGRWPVASWKTACSSTGHWPPATDHYSFRQGFLTPGSDAPPPFAFPKLSFEWPLLQQRRKRPESPVHSGGNRAGFSPDFPLNLRRPARTHLSVGLVQRWKLKLQRACARFASLAAFELFGRRGVTSYHRARARSSRDVGDGAWRPGGKFSDEWSGSHCPFFSARAFCILPTSSRVGAAYSPVGARRSRACRKSG